MTYELYKYYKKGYKIYANYGLSFPHEKLTKNVFESLVNNTMTLENAVIALDEVHIWIDSRSSMTKKNKIISYFLLQTRKASIRLLYTTQHLHQVEKRLRDTTDILVFCKNQTNQTSVVDNNAPDTYILQEYLFQWKTQQKPRLKLLHANPIFPLFDTKEIIAFTE